MYNNKGQKKYSRYNSKYRRKSPNEKQGERRPPEPVWIPKPSPPGTWAAIVASGGEKTETKTSASKAINEETT